MSSPDTTSRDHNELMSDLDRALETVLVECLAVRSGESVLVVTDPAKVELATELVRHARGLQAEAVLAEMEERARHGMEPPPHIAAAMLASDVVVAPTSKSLSHTEARHAASKRGARIASMPDVTEEMLTRTMGGDFAAIRERSRAVAERLTAGEVVDITTEKGTALRLGIEGRSGLADDGDLSRPGAFGNLPAGEGFIAPVEGGATGSIVFDGSMWPVGRLDEPLTVEIVDGYMENATGPAAQRWREQLEPAGRDAFAVAELGIGTNDRAQLTGNILEDEKILGTVHVAFGDNHSFGGTLRVASHQDGIVLKPTLTIDGETLLENGKLLL